MVKIDHLNNPSQTENQTNSQVPANPPSKGLFTLPDSVMKLVPWIPFILEATTGQKIPQMSGTMAEVQTALQQLQLIQTQILTHQQQLTQRLISLETNATNHLSNLTHQFNSLRLTHTKEKKQIEYGNNPSRLEEENQDY